MKNDKTLVTILALSLVVAIAAAGSLAVGLATKPTKVKTVTVTKVRTKIVHDPGLGLPFDHHFDSVQIGPNYSILCRGFSNRPNVDANNDPAYLTKKAIGYRVVTDCLTVANPKPSAAGGHTKEAS